MKKLKDVLVLTSAAMVLAIAIALGFFKIPITQLIEIRFDTLALATAGQMFGPAVGLMIGALSDLGGFLIRPTGPFFPGFTISAAITDLGFIKWKDALQAAPNRTSWTFNGFAEDVYAGGTNTGSNKIGDQFEQIGDDLEEMLPLYDQGKKNETRALAATLNIGAEYTLPVYRPLRFGFLYTSRFAGKYSYHQGMLSANIRPVKWFEFALNGAVSSSGCTAGMVIDLHAKHFNFFIGADRFLGKVSKQFIPLHNMNSSVSLGMSFPL